MSHVEDLISMFFPEWAGDTAPRENISAISLSRSMNTEDWYTSMLDSSWEMGPVITTTSESGLGKSFIIYNRDALDIYSSCFICEGAINAATMGERGIAMSGKAVSRYQINLLIKSPCKRFILLLDPDAKEYALDLAFKLQPFKKVKVIFLPEGKDVNDLKKKEVLKLIYRVHYQSYSDLMKLKQSL